MDITQMVYTKTRLIIFLVAEDGEALYSQQKQDQELTVEVHGSCPVEAWLGEF